ncbi:hypothetical protein ABI59_06300 [Acidobacteria bacterium Mor1]|nr:hypothetical protein ABI59_06300 [Acidobacteria bacterium Mor1]
MSPRPGDLVLFWDEQTLSVGVVASEEKRRWRVFAGTGEERRVTTQRLALHLDTLAADGSVDREQANRRVEQARADLESGAADCDLPLVWELASEEPGPLSLGPLAELALGSDGPRERGVLLWALAADGLHFERRGDDWAPRPGEQVERLRQQREQARAREAEKAAALAAWAAAPRGEFAALPDNAAFAGYGEALRKLALFEDAAEERDRALALEALSAAGIGFDREHEGAFRLLRAAGIFESDDENLPLRRYELSVDFAPAIIGAASAAAAAGPQGTREDLTGEPVFTIDSAKTREIDDGVSLREVDGDLHLGIHIADPSAFVPVGDPVDEEALRRGVTHYFPDLRLPMIPAAISEEAASLVRDQPRPALSFLVTFGADGELRDWRLTRSLIRVGTRLTYDESDRAIDGQEHPCAGPLRRLAGWAAAREGARIAAGAVVIQSPEVDLRVDADGRIELERMDAESPARRCVTETMVLAGELAARFCAEHRLPAIHRRQAAPAEPGPDGPVVDPVAICRVRRGMRRGEAGLKPGRHHGLGLEAYAQATSPLRRYQDLATHRQILAVLAGEEPPYDEEALQRVCATTDRADLDARRAERAANRYWLLRYLEERVGQQVEGTVVEVTPRPVVLLDETLVEHPVPGLKGVELGERVQLTIKRVNPRAEILSLR